jgi:hypothetical protein
VLSFRITCSARIIHKPSTAEPYLTALAGSSSLADPWEKGDTNLLSLQEKGSCPLLSPIAVFSVVFLAITGIYGTSLRGL